MDVEYITAEVGSLALFGLSVPILFMPSSFLEIITSMVLPAGVYILESIISGF